MRVNAETAFGLRLLLPCLSRGQRSHLVELRLLSRWRMVAQWAANSVAAGTPSQAGKGETNLRRPAMAVKGGLEGFCVNPVRRCRSHLVSRA
jgi:hypothetical protein